MKVNWIRSIAYGIGFAGLSTIPQQGFAQSSPYVSPSIWSHFNYSAPPQTQRKDSQTVDTESPHYRTVSTPVPRTAGQQTPTQQPAQNHGQFAAQGYAAPPTTQYSMPPSLVGPQYTQTTPAYTVARRNDSQAMIDGGGHGHVERLPAGPVSSGGALASEQFHDYPQTPVPSPYMEAASAPWESGQCASGACGSGLSGDFAGMGCGPVRPPLFPWFGGTDILFWSMANNTNHRLVLETGMPRTSLLSTRDVDPGNGIGYDVSFGRYLGCGQYAVSVNYMNFDPSRERAMVSGMPGNFMIAMPAFNNIGYYADHTDPASAYTSIYDTFDAMPNLAVERDVSFQGLEVNLWSFGFGGARRLAPAFGSGLSCGFHNPLGNHCNSGCGPQGACAPAPAYGFGGFGGPLERPCGGTSQLALFQGFRWFQFNDDFRFSAYDVAAQSMLDIEARNDLFGYQIGGRWNYCLTPRINVGLGSRFGVYANQVEVHQRVGDATMPARYQSATPGSRRHVNMHDRGTAFASLGEIDLGAGFRLTDCWTIRGGYRVLGATGVATSVGLIRHEMFSENLNARHVANDSILLHGAYIGSEFNW